MSKTLEELRQYARERYRLLNNVPPERFQDGRSHPDNKEYHREIKRRYYYRHKERLSLLKKEEYQRKKNNKNKDVSGIHSQQEGVQEVEDHRDDKHDQP